MSYMRKTLGTLIEEAENRRGQKLGPTAIIQLEEDFRTFSWGLTDEKDSKVEEKKSRKIAP